MSQTVIILIYNSSNASNLYRANFRGLDNGRNTKNVSLQLSALQMKLNIYILTIFNLAIHLHFKNGFGQP